MKNLMKEKLCYSPGLYKDSNYRSHKIDWFTIKTLHCNINKTQHSKVSFKNY